VESAELSAAQWLGYYHWRADRHRPTAGEFFPTMSFNPAVFLVFGQHTDRQRARQPDPRRHSRTQSIIVRYTATRSKPTFFRLTRILWIIRANCLYPAHWASSEAKRLVSQQFLLGWARVPEGRGAK